ncbi:hypothetical protein IG631_00532 [Alternaria alternata]|nr:hypothetical protein IG631_00532 [Alternaria alternata]
MNSSATSKCWKGRNTSLFSSPTTTGRDISRRNISNSDTPMLSPLTSPSTPSLSSPAIQPGTTYLTNPGVESRARSHFRRRRNTPPFCSSVDSDIINQNHSVAVDPAACPPPLRISPRVSPRRSPPFRRTTNVVNPFTNTTLPFQCHQDQETCTSFSRDIDQPSSSESDIYYPRESLPVSFSSSETLLDEHQFSFDSTEVEVLSTPFLPRVIKEGERSTETRRPSVITIVEEGREWWGFKDEGTRRAATALGVEFPTACCEAEDGGREEQNAREEHGIRFWHRDGRIERHAAIAIENDEDAKTEGETEGGLKRAIWKTKRAALGRVLRRLHCGRL